MGNDADNAKPSISPRENGPLRVEGLENLIDATGNPIDLAPKKKGNVALCRCGYSRTKPFCDGNHRNTDFRGTKLSDGEWDLRTDYEGEAVTVHDNRGICSHAGYCTDQLPEVFRMGTEPWIDADGAAGERVAEQTRRCPSGALSHSVDGVEYRDQERPPTIQVAAAGPYVVTGGIELQDAERGEGASLEHYVLCRCGRSKNKPFCDGTHWYVDFADPGLDVNADRTAGPETGGAAGDTGSGADAGGESRTVWHKVAELDELPEGRVKTVSVGTYSIALTHIDGAYGALDNHCPHQGGPLGEGTIENGCLRCPWHGWDFDPITGAGKQADAAIYEIEVRDDGVYVAIEEVVEKIRTTSDVMVETMVNWGVTHVFGMVGHSNLGLAEAIRRQEGAGNLTYIGIRHEGAAAFACSGFAKLSGKPAACLTIAGPGATNLLTGLWDAKVDRAPVLALTGQVNTQVFGPGAFQEIDLATAFNGVAAFSQTVLPNSKHAELMTLALKTAIVERDVSHLIFPDEVQVLAVGDDAEASSPEGRIGPVEIVPPLESVTAAVAKIAAAERPVIIVGYGARGAMDAIVELAGRLNAPVLTTFKAKGQISDRHPLAGGVLGRSGTPIASWMMNEADLLVVFGASFSDHTGIERTRPIIQVDFDRMALGKFHPVEVPVWGEIGATAALFAERLPDHCKAIDQRPDVAARWELWRAEKQSRAQADGGNGINSATIFAALTAVAPADAVIAVDVGNNTYSFGRYFECEAQSILMSGYLGSIGFGFPAAMGAWAAAPGRAIIAVTGDGGFGQYMGEITTAVKYGMNITHVLLNNSELGKISKEQRAGGWQVWQTSLRNPNFAEFARSCGAHGTRVEDPAELHDAIGEGLAYDGPALIEIIADVDLI